MWRLLHRQWHAQSCHLVHSSLFAASGCKCWWALQQERDPQHTEQETADLEDAFARWPTREEVVQPSTDKRPEDHGAEAHG